MKKYAIVFCALSFAVTIQASIVFHNRSGVDLYIAPYYVKRVTIGSKIKETHQAAQPVFVKSDNSISFSRPSRKLWWDRDVFISEKREKLKESIDTTDLGLLAYKNIGLTMGNSFYVGRNKKGNIAAYRATQWGLMKAGSTIIAPMNLANKAVRNAIKSKLASVQQNPYKGKVAKVRVGNELPPEEKAFVAKRKPRVKKALEKYLGTSLDDKYIPTIAMVGSGGGYRAMFATTGFLAGADQTGLLDSTMYVSALSGSTWAVGFWMTYGLPMQQVKQKLIAITDRNKGLRNFSASRVKLMANAILTDFVYYRPITIVDFYGILIANALFEDLGDKRHRVYLAQQADLLKDGSFPMPIYTAIAEDKTKKTTRGLKPEENWYEFTPFEVGGSWLKHYVPSWAFGRKFEKGTSIDDGPPISFGQDCGRFGSAFTVTFNRVYEEVGDSIKLKTTRAIVKGILNFGLHSDRTLKDKRIASGQVYNFAYAMPQAPDMVRNLHVLRMGDAGIDCNLPYEPLSGKRPGRLADVLIFFDGSSGVIGAPALKCVEDHARKHKLKFPKIDYTNIGKRVVSIFTDKNDSSVPVVVYMPRIKDELMWKEYITQKDNKYTKTLKDFDPEKCTQESYCTTANFNYSKLESGKLIMQTELNMLESNPQIKDAIRFKINQKSKVPIKAIDEGSIGQPAPGPTKEKGLPPGSVRTQEGKIFYRPGQIPAAR